MLGLKKKKKAEDVVSATVSKVKTFVKILKSCSRMPTYAHTPGPHQNVYRNGIRHWDGDSLEKPPDFPTLHGLNLSLLDEDKIIQDSYSAC